MQSQWWSIICSHTAHNLRWSSFATLFLRIGPVFQELPSEVIQHPPWWWGYFINLSQREIKHFNTFPKPNTGRARRLAEHAKLSRYFWKACTWRESCHSSLLCNRDNYDWETIKQLAGTHFYFKAPEHPDEITYTAYILLWMFSFSICTRANYRKLLHLFTLENLTGEQARPPSKNTSLKQARGTFFLKTCSLVGPRL